MKVYIVVWDVPYDGGSIQDVFTSQSAADIDARQRNLDDHGTPEPNPRGEGAFVETWEVK